LIGSAWVFLQTLINWRRDGGNKVFAQASEWRLMLMMFLPTLAYMISMVWLGLYLSSWLFIASFMIWQGRYTFFKSAIVGFAINAFLFVLFEIWFKLPLPKGPVETWMGY
jgi:putative tricarboxylic transport membrane protein